MNRNNTPSIEKIKESILKKTFLTLVALASLALAGCHHTSDEAVQLHRFEKVLFDTPVEQLQSTIAATGNEFQTDLLNIQPQNPQFMAMLADFAQDPTMRTIYHIVDSVMGDMSKISAQLGAALTKAQELHPAMKYDKVFTYVSGSFDYDMRVGCNGHELIISLDQYVLPYTQRFNYFNSPLFLVQQSKPQYMVADCMAAIAREHIAIPQDHEMTMLDYMMAEGKAIYFAQQTLPHTPDSILMRYSQEQMEWMEQNEKNVWVYLQTNKVLFDVDYNRFHNFIDDAPKTNAFNNSAPRTPYYIGWHIISKYMANTSTSMQQLFEETDAQKILNESNYRPK